MGTPRPGSAARGGADLPRGRGVVPTQTSPGGVLPGRLGARRPWSPPSGSARQLGRARQDGTPWGRGPQTTPRPRPRPWTSGSAPGPSGSAPGANPQRPRSFPPAWLLLPPRPDGCGARRSEFPEGRRGTELQSGPRRAPGTPAERTAPVRVPLRPSRLLAPVAGDQVSEVPRPPGGFLVPQRGGGGGVRVAADGPPLRASARSAAGTFSPWDPRGQGLVTALSCRGQGLNGPGRLGTA